MKTQHILTDREVERIRRLLNKNRNIIFNEDKDECDEILEFLEATDD